MQVSDVPAGISQFTLSDDQSRIMYVSTVQSALKKPSDLYGDLDKADAISADEKRASHQGHQKTYLLQRKRFTSFLQSRSAA